MRINALFPNTTLPQELDVIGDTREILTQVFHNLDFASLKQQLLSPEFQERYRPAEMHNHELHLARTDFKAKRSNSSSGDEAANASVVANAEKSCVPIAPVVVAPAKGQNAYNRLSVLGDGDCGYTAFGITRQQAFALINQHLDDEQVINLLRPAIGEIIVSEEFFDYLRAQGVIGRTLELAVIEANLERYTNAPDIIAAYLHYDILEKQIDMGWAHPAVLQALAHIQNIAIHIWQLDADDQLIPHHQQLYSHYVPAAAAQELNLLFANGNHFERLERVAPAGDAVLIQPLVSSQEGSGDSPLAAEPADANPDIIKDSSVLSPNEVNLAIIPANVADALSLDDDNNEDFFNSHSFEEIYGWFVSYLEQYPEFLLRYCPDKPNGLSDTLSALLDYNKIACYFWEQYETDKPFETRRQNFQGGPNTTFEHVTNWLKPTQNEAWQVLCWSLQCDPTRIARTKAFEELVIDNIKKPHLQIYASWSAEILLDRQNGHNLTNKAIAELSQGNFATDYIHKLLLERTTVLEAYQYQKELIAEKILKFFDEVVDRTLKFNLVEEPYFANLLDIVKEQQRIVADLTCSDQTQHKYPIKFLTNFFESAQRHLESLYDHISKSQEYYVHEPNPNELIAFYKNLSENYQQDIQNILHQKLQEIIEKLYLPQEDEKVMLAAVKNDFLLSEDEIEAFPRFASRLIVLNMVELGRIKQVQKANYNIPNFNLNPIIKPINQGQRLADFQFKSVHDEQEYNCYRLFAEAYVSEMFAHFVLQAPCYESAIKVLEEVWVKEKLTLLEHYRAMLVLLDFNFEPDEMWSKIAKDYKKTVLNILYQSNLAWLKNFNKQAWAAVQAEAYQKLISSLSQFESLLSNRKELIASTIKNISHELTLKQFSQLRNDYFKLLKIFYTQHKERVAQKDQAAISSGSAKSSVATNLAQTDSKAPQSAEQSCDNFKYYSPLVTTKDSSFLKHFQNVINAQSPQELEAIARDHVQNFYVDPCSFSTWLQKLAVKPLEESKNDWLWYLSYEDLPHLSLGITDKDGNNLLMLACQQKQMPLVILLLGLGLDPSQTNVHNKSALNLLEEQRQGKILDLIANWYKFSESQQLFESNTWMSLTRRNNMQLYWSKLAQTEQFIAINQRLIVQVTEASRFYLRLNSQLQALKRFIFPYKHAPWIMGINNSLIYIEQVMELSKLAGHDEYLEDALVKLIDSFDNLLAPDDLRRFQERLKPFKRDLVDLLKKSRTTKNFAKRSIENNLISTCASLASNLERSIQKYQDLEQQHLSFVTKQTREVIIKDGEILKLNQCLAITKGLLVDSLNAKGELQSQVSTLDEKLEAKQEELANLKQQVIEKDEKVAALQDEVKEKQENSRAEISAINAIVTEQQEKLTVQQEKLDEQQAKLNEQQEKLDEQKEKITEQQEKHQTEIAALNEMVTEQQEKMTEQQQKHQSEISTLNEKLNKQQEGHQAEISVVNQKLAFLENLVMTMASQNANPAATASSSGSKPGFFPNS